MRRFEIRYERWSGWMMGLLGMGRRFSHVELDGPDVVVRMGWAFRSRIPRAGIASVERDHDKVWGWGVHGWRSRWLVNGSSQGLVRFELDPPVRSRAVGIPVQLRTLRVSLEHPDELIAALR